MQTKKKTILFWSGGKNSALLLHTLKQSQDFEILSLVTVFNRDTNRVDHHGIPDPLIVEQSKMLKLPVQRVYVSPGSTNDEFLSQVSSIVKIFARTNVTHVAFGETKSLTRRKLYEDLCAHVGLTALFPLWEKSGAELAKSFIGSHHKALVTAINKDVLNANYLAFEYNEEWISKLPEGIDQSGENDEFHTFVTFGPSFKMRVPFSKAIAVDEDNFLVSLLKEP